MVVIKSFTQINGIRRSCELASKTLEFVGGFVNAGIATHRLNDIADRFIKEHGGISACLRYNGFPKSICTSINNVVCHGIPSEDEHLKEGDIVNIDITTILDGYYGDVSATYAVGEISKQASKLIKVTREALEKSIKALKPGKKLNDCVGKIIEPMVKKAGFSVVRELGGHGVGIKFHEEPFVFHFDNKQSDVILKPGMVFTIEPMINASKKWQVIMDKKDGWTIRTTDKALSAQFEHTVLITDTGYEVLTRIE